MRQRLIEFRKLNFYPRSPCGERRHETAPYRVPETQFLSTLSLRRATNVDCNCHNARPISIHALLAESDAADISARRGARISIHALLAESDRAL